MSGLGRIRGAMTGEKGVQLIPQARLSGPMPWVIAIMVALTVIAAAAGLALAKTISAASAELSGGVTVQIVEPDPGARGRQAQAALDVLRKTPGVASARIVPQSELDALIDPWLGGGGGGEAIPVPALIDARLTNAVTAERMNALKGPLARVAPSARVDAQSEWLRPVFEAIRSLQWLALALVALLALAMASAVLLAVRNALGNNRDIIEIVHLLGGTDSQIAREFQRSVGIDAAGGGAVGLAAGLVVVLLLGKQFASLGAGLVSAGKLGLADWALLAVVPVAGAVLAMATARLAVLSALRRMV